MNGLGGRTYTRPSAGGADHSAEIEGLEGRVTALEEAPAAVAAGTPVRERVVQFERLTTSGTWTKADVLARAEFAGLTESDVEMEVILVGGGAGGRSGSNAPGGHPGMVSIARYRMSELAATLSYVIGAGGGSNGSGGITVWGGTTTGDSLRYVNGGETAATAALKDSHVFGRSRSMASYPDLSVYSSSTARPNSPDGPGAGGIASGALTVGGFGSLALGPDAARPAYISTETAEDGKAGVPYSFGAGGAGNASGNGTPGGTPGGGGGGGSSAGGNGGNGEIRIVYKVLEVA